MGTIGSVITLLNLFFKALPFARAWFETLVKGYVAKKIEEHDTEFAMAVIGVIKYKDQSILERAIGSSNAGASARDQTDVEQVPASEWNDL